MNQNDRIVIRGATLTKRGERVLSTFAIVALFSIMGVIGGIEAGTIWPFNSAANAVETRTYTPQVSAAKIATLTEKAPTRAHRLAQNRSTGRAIAATYGITGSQWDCLDRLWHRESRWDHLAVNRSSGALGIPQKMNNTSSTFKVDPKAQIRWGIEYIEMRYTTPCRALNFHLSQGWY